MQTHELKQGTPDWDAHRLNHDNASDAPSVLDCSPYKTRSELIRELATGVRPEITPFQQKIFDDGHRYEALARPLAEAIIGADLYPVTGSEGKYSASFDGLTLDEATGFEHKSLNDDLRAVMVEGCIGADLPKHYRVQMEQQCMVSGAGRILFMASKWEGDQLVEERHCWYTPDAALRAEIIAGWEQLEADVAAYVPEQVIEKPVAATILALPALVVQTRGEVVASNLPEFQRAAQAFLDNIKTDLKTDEDFANAKATVKFCDEVEGKLEHAKAAALAQTSSIDEVLRAVDQIKEQVRQRRLSLEKLVTRREQEIKEGILTAGKLAYSQHMADLEREIAPIRITATIPDFAGAMKGKRTLTSLQNAVDTTLANAKIAANQAAQDIRAKLAWFHTAGAEYKFLFNDLQGIIGKPMDDFQLVVNTRIDGHKRAEEAKAEALRVKIAAEERAKAEAAAAAERAANERAAEAQRQAELKAAQDADAARQREAAEANARAEAAARQQALAQQRDAAHAEALDMNAAFDANKAIQNAQAKPTVTSAPADLLDAAEAVQAADPTDSQLVFLVMSKYEMSAAQAIARLERFDGAASRKDYGVPAAGEPNITMIPVQSSQIAAIGFDPAAGILAIQFPARNGAGSVYHYRNFTQELFEEFRNAPSVGSYFGKNIKPHTDRFPFEKVAA